MAQGVRGGLSPEAMFWAHVVLVPNGCWMWQGARDRHGYGRWSSRRWPGSALAHRRAFESERGLLDSSLTLDHLCRVPGCVRPDHLEAVTQAENVQRGRKGNQNIGKTTCKRGHRFTPENTIRTTKGRECRTCRREYHQPRRNAAKREGRAVASQPRRF